MSQKGVHILTQLLGNLLCDCFRCLVSMILRVQSSGRGGGGTVMIAYTRLHGLCQVKLGYM